MLMCSLPLSFSPTRANIYNYKILSIHSFPHYCVLWLTTCVLSPHSLPCQSRTEQFMVHFEALLIEATGICLGVKKSDNYIV